MLSSRDKMLDQINARDITFTTQNASLKPTFNFFESKLNYNSLLRLTAKINMSSVTRSIRLYILQQY